MENEKLTYEDIRTIALANGINDNKVAIGMWAKLSGFSNKRKMHKGKTTIYYTKDQPSKVQTIEKRYRTNYNSNGIENINLTISFVTRN